MPTIDTEIAEDALTWFNLSISPFEHCSPRSLFSPSLPLESLSPPNISEEPSSPRPWETPPDPERVHNVSLLRDCYLPELFTSLESRSQQALHILKYKTSLEISRVDITNIVDNIIDSEILCYNLTTRQLENIKKKMLNSMLQSLSSSTPEEAVLTE